MGEIDDGGLAQARLLFDDDASRRPKFVFHEFSQPDSAPTTTGRTTRARARRSTSGHPYRPRPRCSSTARTARVDAVHRHDGPRHGDPGRVPRREPRVDPASETAWPPSRRAFSTCCDLAVEIVVSADGRTVRVPGRDNDSDDAGEHPAIVGARVLSPTVDGRLSRTRLRTPRASGLASRGTSGRRAVLAISADAEHATCASTARNW